MHILGIGGDDVDKSNCETGHVESIKIVLCTVVVADVIYIIIPKYNS